MNKKNYRDIEKVLESDNLSKEEIVEKSYNIGYHKGEQYGIIFGFVISILLILSIAIVTS